MGNIKANLRCCIILTEYRYRKNPKESMQLQLKTTKEVLENRISELYLKNERLQTELKRWYGTPIKFSDI